MKPIRRAVRVALAFVRMGWLLDLSYPLAFLLSQTQALILVFTYYFVDRIVDVNDAQVGGDYFTFVVVGILVVRLLSVGLNDLGKEVDDAIQQGRFEMLLMEPVRWRVLPFALVQWQLVQRVVILAIIAAMTVPMGAEYDLGGVAAAVVLVAVGMLATLGIGIVAMSVKVLARRADPVLTLYTLAAQVLSGQFFPVEELPSWLRWLSYLLPQTHILAAVRQLVMPGGEDVGGATPMEAFIGVGLFGIAATCLGAWMLGRSLELGRRLGVLGGY